MYKLFIKRLLDFGIALIGLLILSPIFLLLVIILWLDFKENPFFLQPRPGKDEKIFQVIKFKTMNNRKDMNGNLLPDKIRTTAIGRVVRKTSLDEIPQLINVLMGDMSLIGPRPLRTHYLPYYNEKERLRHSVRPGITGLAQVSGRNFLKWEERFAFDIEYVENLSFKEDIKILVRTVQKVLAAKDIAENPDKVVLRFDHYRKAQLEQDSGDKLNR